MNLGPRDVDAILRLLLDLYAPRTLEEFFECSARLLKEVVQFDHGDWYVFNVEFSNVRYGRPSERDRRLLQVLQPHLAQAYTNAQRYSALTTTATPPHDAFDLTPREKEVAFWLASGKTNWEIGAISRLSVRTAEKYVERVLRKLHVENRATAALRLREAGYAVASTDDAPAPAT